jgi:hypothetical protein
VFGVDNSSTVPFEDNRFEFEFELDGVPIQIKDPVSEGYASYEESVLKSVSGVLPSEVTGIRSPSQVKSTIAGIGATPSHKSKYPADNVWSHLTVARGQFERVGNDAGRGWSTVRGFKVIFTNRKGKTTTLTISDAIFVGGGDRALTGTYRCVIQACRQMEDDNSNVIYYQLSPPSAQSSPINLNHEGLQITINGTTLNQLDPQADQLWIYLFGGWLDAYYRFAVVPANVSQGMSIDELEAPAGSNLDEVAERTRIPAWGFTYCQLNSSGVPELTASSDAQISLRTSELDALTANVRLEPYLITAPDNIIDIGGPHMGRMWALTNEGYLYPSTLTSPAIFNSLQVIDLTRYGRPHWVAVTGTGLYVGMEKDIITIQGDGVETPDRARANFWAQPLNLAHPPIDDMHWREGNSVIYRGSDGLMELKGGSIGPVPTAGTSLLWRGQDRHDIQALNTGSGRFRCCVDNGIFYMLAPEGDETSGNAIYRYIFNKQQWSRLQFDQVTSFRSIFNNPDGSILAGDAAGRVWTLDDTTTQRLDNGEYITLGLLTPILDGGNPLSYKDPFDFQAHVNTGGQNMSVDFYRDGDAEATLTLTDMSTASINIYRASLHSLGNFIKAQVGIDGSSDNFVLSAMDLTYRVRPQRMVNLDTGYFMADEPGDWMWLQEIEVDAIVDSASFNAYVYFNDVLEYTSPAQTATVGVRDVYYIPLPRGLKGERPRIVLRTSDTTGAGAIGMDPYSVRVRMASTGNKDMNRTYKRVWPAGEAP